MEVQALSRAVRLTKRARSHLRARRLCTPEYCQIDAWAAARSLGQRPLDRYAFLFEPFHTGQQIAIHPSHRAIDNIF